MKERHGAILEMLRERGKVSVSELARVLYVCEMTVRRDLKQLEAEGRIKRYNGGAMLFIKEGDIPFTGRKLLHSKEKMRLAKEAAALAKNGDVVFIDSSSTCTYLIPHLSLKKDIHILTNSIAGAILATQYHIPCLLIGGACYEKDMCTIGGFASDMLERVYMDIAFFSSNAVSDDGLITDSDAEQTRIRQLAMRQAARSVFIFTKEKQNRKATYTVCKSEDAFRVICE